MCCQEYFEKVQNIVEVLKSLRGSLCDEIHLKEELPQRANAVYTAQQIKEARERIHDKTVAYGLLVRADHERYGKLIEEIENGFLKGHDDYPKTPTEAYNLFVNYQNYVTVNMILNHGKNSWIYTGNTEEFMITTKTTLLLIRGM
jgi:hypothetical protein